MPAAQTSTLILGGHGQIGSALTQRLRAQGQSVLRATRRPGGDSDDVAVDLASGTGLDAAFARARRAFLLCPPGYAQQHQLLSPAIEAATRHGLEHVVLMTAMGANADPSAPLRQAELQLERSGLNYTLLRPNWFMQNFETFWLAGIRAAGLIALPVSDAKGSFIDVRDIAAVAAAVLGHPTHYGRAYELTGSEALDHAEVAAILSRVSGRAIRFQDVPPEALRPHLLDAGLPAEYADFLLQILGFFKLGYSAAISPSVQDILGRAPIRFEDYAQEQRAAWAA